MTTKRSGSRGFLFSRLVRLYLLATTLGVLALAGWLFFFVANDEYTWWRTGVTVYGAYLLSPNRIELIVNSCNRNPEVSLLRETDVDVQVKVVTHPHLALLGSTECLDTVEIQLQGPLGARDVVDKHTGEVVRVRSE